jgi:predicted phosphate transport protein (TIGR00153 family)
VPNRLSAMPSIGQLLRGSDREIFDLFERAGANIVRAAELLDEMMAGFPETQGLAREILICEQDGDQITHALIRRLNQSFVTPIDRTDVLRLASALDDIVDFIEEVADYLGLYRIEAPMVQAQALANVLLDSTRQIEMAIPLVREYKDITQHTVEVNRLENEGDRITRAAIASLFEGGIDPMVVIRWKDIFERLENAIDSTERAANFLEGIVIKNA